MEFSTQLIMEQKQKSSVDAEIENKLGILQIDSGFKIWGFMAY